jgi:hypothetical protein
MRLHGHLEQCCSGNNSGHRCPHLRAAAALSSRAGACQLRARGCAAVFQTAMGFWLRNDCSSGSIRDVELFHPCVRQSAVASGGEKSTFVLLPSPWMWAIFPFFGGIATCWEITLGVWMCFGNSSQASRYEGWSNQKAGFDATRLLRLMILTIAVPMGIATVLALPIHTSVGESGFRVGHFGSLLWPEPSFRT